MHKETAESLFSSMEKGHFIAAMPLALRMRPRTLEDFIGQEHFLGPDKLLARMLRADRLTSLIFYGPPGAGKTSLAKVIAEPESAGRQENTGQVSRPGPYDSQTSLHFPSSGLLPSVALRLDPPEFSLIQAEVMRYFVANDFAYLSFYFGLRAAHLLNGFLKDQYAVREYHPISVCALGLRDAFVQPQERHSSPNPGQLPSIGVVLHHYIHVLQPASELLRQVIDCLGHQFLKAISVHYSVFQSSGIRKPR